MWRPNAQPTRANVKKRLFAAIDALASADHLISQMKDKGALTATRNARAWANDAIKKLDGNSGKRREN